MHVDLGLSEEMKSYPQNVFITLLCLGLGACASHRAGIPEAPIKRPTPPPQVIGRIYAVNPSHGFAVIESSLTPDTGTELQARSIDGQQTAVLKVTPEKKNPFIIADIMKGKPLPGESVTK